MFFNYKNVLEVEELVVIKIYKNEERKIKKRFTFGNRINHIEAKVCKIEELVNNTQIMIDMVKDRILESQWNINLRLQDMCFVQEKIIKLEKENQALLQKVLALQEKIRKSKTNRRI